MVGGKRCAAPEKPSLRIIEIGALTSEGVAQNCTGHEGVDRRFATEEAGFLLVIIPLLSPDRNKAPPKPASAPKPTLEKSTLRRWFAGERVLCSMML